MRKNKLIALGMGLLLLGGMSSCLKDNETEVVTYDDTAVTAFSLGTLTRTMHTTSSKGEDSTYVVNVTGTKYPFSIDQQRGLIYNADSLPVGTKVDRVVCTLSTKNSGTAVFNLRTKDGTLDSLVVYSNTDSIDLSKPTELRVYAMSGRAYRKYTVQVNVHEEEADEFRWTKALDNELNFAKTPQLRLLSVGERPYVLFTADNGSTMLADLRQHIADATSDTGVMQILSPSAFDNAVSNGNTLYVLEKEGCKLHAIGTDGLGNETHVDHEGCDTSVVDRLGGASAKEIYALSKQGTLIVSTDGCRSWQEESLDSDADLLPTENINCTLHRLRTNDTMERVLLVGTQPGKDYALVWMKIADETQPGAGRWMLLADGTKGEGDYRLPSKESLSIVGYDDKDMGLGMSADGTLAAILLSADGGINWKSSATYAWPEGLSGKGWLAACADKSGTLWVVLGETGQVWRGRLNRLGWETK